MGKLSRKILGNINGTVGDITFSKWRGITVVKAKTEGRDSQPSPEQNLVREKFKVLSKVAEAFKKILPIGLDSKDQAMTGYNSFIKENYSIVSGTPGSLVVFYPMLTLSKGALDSLNDLTVSVAAQVITLNWNNENAGETSDSIIAIAYNPILKKIVLNMNVIRSASTCALLVPNTWSGVSVHVFAFVRNKLRGVSNSQYGGLVTIG